jgi:hypothetical protein
MKRIYITPETIVSQMMGECVLTTDSLGHLSGGEALSKESDVFEWDDNFSGDIWNDTDNSLDNDPWGNNELNEK